MREVLIAKPSGSLLIRKWQGITVHGNKVCEFWRPTVRFPVSKTFGSMPTNQSVQVTSTTSSVGPDLLQKSQEKWEAWEEGIEKVIYGCRFLTFLAVWGSLVGSFLCFIKGCTYVAASFKDYFMGRGKMMLMLVEAIDVYLVGTVMLVFGMGLYELFVSNLDIATSPHDRSNLFGLFTLKLSLDVGYVIRGLTNTLESLETLKQEIEGPDCWKAKYATLEKDRDALRIIAVKNQKALQLAEEKHRDYVSGVASKLEGQKAAGKIAIQAAVDKAVAEAADRFRSLAEKKISRELKQQLEALTASGRLLPVPTPAVDMPASVPLPAPRQDPSLVDADTPGITLPTAGEVASPIDLDNDPPSSGEGDLASAPKDATEGQQ